MPKAPKNWTRHGYHLSQEMFPNQPRTIQDAITKHKISEERSLEWKRQYYPTSFYQRHVLANFVKGATKPFTKEALYKLIDRTLSFTRPEDVDKKQGKVYASTDWGGGETAFTVPLITQCIHPKAPIFKVLYIDRMDEVNVEKQADRFINLCDAYEVDKIGIDAGGGSRQVQKVETMFADRCRKISYTTRPDVPLPRASEIDKMNKEDRFTIDRTYAFESLKSLIDNPYLQGQYAFPRIILPGADMEKIGWVIENFEAVEGEIAIHKSTGQDYIRYIHDPGKPDDAVHSFNYNWIIQMIDQGDAVWLRSF